MNEDVVRANLEMMRSRDNGVGCAVTSYTFVESVANLLFCYQSDSGRIVSFGKMVERERINELTCIGAFAVEWVSPRPLRIIDYELRHRANKGEATDEAAENIFESIVKFNRGGMD